MFADEEENNIGMLPHIAMGKIVTSGLLNKLNPNPRAKHSLCQANYKGLASPYLWLGQVLLSLCLSTTTLFLSLSLSLSLSLGTTQLKHFFKIMIYSFISGL